MEISKLQNGALVYGLYQEEDEIVYKTICKVKGYDPFNNFLWVDSKDEIEEFIGFEPIPLTEEWLLKCQIKNKRLILGGSVFTICGRTRDYRLLDQDYLYLHQLQNLYFALTGEELQITP
jgi:hypothetical protein